MFQSKVELLCGQKRKFWKNLELLATGTVSRSVWSKIEVSVKSSRAEATVKSYWKEDQARKKWLRSHNLEDDENGLLLYLANRSSSMGSSSLGQALAAFQFTQDRPSDNALHFSKCIVAAKRRDECTTRKPQGMALASDVSKVWNLLNAKSEPKLERDVLMVLLSWEALLRASEAAELQWNDLVRVGNLYKVRVRKAKNDQLRFGRESFFLCKEGSNMDQLLCRWKVRSQERSQYIFPNLNSHQKLTPSAVASTTKKILLEAGVHDVSHHGLRRGCANFLQEEGLSAEEIQKKGRWRSEAGLSRYLRDNSTAQGIQSSSNSAPTQVPWLQTHAPQ